MARKPPEWDERASLGVVRRAVIGRKLQRWRWIPRPAAGKWLTAKVFHAGTKLADDDRVLTSGGRVLCATALGFYRGFEAQKRAYALMTDIRWDGFSQPTTSAGAPSSVSKTNSWFSQQRFARNAQLTGGFGFVVAARFSQRRQESPLFRRPPAVGSHHCIPFLSASRKT